MARSASLAAPIRLSPATSSATDLPAPRGEALRGPGAAAPATRDRAAALGHRFAAQAAPVIQRTEDDALRLAKRHYKGTATIASWQDAMSQKGSFSDAEWSAITHAYNAEASDGSYFTPQQGALRQQAARTLQTEASRADPIEALAATMVATRDSGMAPRPAPRTTGLRLRNRTQARTEERYASPSFHPMADVTPDDGGDILNELQAEDRSGTLAHLALESTPAARAVMDRYRTSRPRGEADATLLKAMISMRELHHSGAAYRSAVGKDLDARSPHQTEHQANVGRARTSAAELADAYGLDERETRALTGYTNANKTVRDLPDGPNPHFMGPHAHWGHHGTGWNALASAMTKVPNLGQLGLRMTTYRASRPEEARSLDDLEGANVVHGVRVMAQGQRHYLSTALTYNVHFGESRIRDAGGIQALTGTSGVYIDPWSTYPSVDGGEVLYPPGFTSRVEGRHPARYRGQEESYPVHRLRELRPSEIQPPDRRLTVEDENLARVAPAHRRPKEKQD